MSQHLTRVFFRMSQDDDGYPPITTETLWAESVGKGTYRLVNSPFFAYGVGYGDIVSAAEEDGELRFRGLVERSGHTTCRVALYSAENGPRVKAALHRLGCDTEDSHLPSLFSVDIPPTVDYDAVVRTLEQGHSEDRWDFEIANPS